MLRQEPEGRIPAFLRMLAPHVVGRIGDDHPTRVRKDTLEQTVDRVRQRQAEKAAAREAGPQTQDQNDRKG